MYKVNTFDKISAILVIIGSINWGLIGVLNINLISLLVAGSILLQRCVYILMSICAFDLIYLFLKCSNFKFLEWNIFTT